MKNLLLLLLILPFTVAAQDENSSVLKPVQQQLEAYNNRDIDAFMANYADSVKVFSFPDQLLYQGKDKMYDRYAMMFNLRPHLHAEVTNRMLLGNTVIDRERVVFDINQPIVNAIAIYKVSQGLIYEVYFISE